MCIHTTSISLTWSTLTFSRLFGNSISAFELNDEERKSSFIGTIISCQLLIFYINYCFHSSSSFLFLEGGEGSRERTSFSGMLNRSFRISDLLDRTYFWDDAPFRVVSKWSWVSLLFGFNGCWGCFSDVRGPKIPPKSPQMFRTKIVHTSGTVFEVSRTNVETYF